MSNPSNPNSMKIRFIAANPDDQPRLAIGREYRAIRDHWHDLDVVLDARASDCLPTEAPWHHYCGHSTGSSLIVTDTQGASVEYPFGVIGGAASPSTHGRLGVFTCRVDRDHRSALLRGFTTIVAYDRDPAADDVIPFVELYYRRLREMAPPWAFGAAIAELRGLGVDCLPTERSRDH